VKNQLLAFFAELITYCPKKATKNYLQIPRMRIIISVHAELRNCITTVTLKSLYTAVDPIKLTGIAMFLKLGIGSVAHIYHILGEVPL
jgi:hypothetical protein